MAYGRRLAILLMHILDSSIHRKLRMVKFFLEFGRLMVDMSNISFGLLEKFFIPHTDFKCGRHETFCLLTTLTQAIVLFLNAKRAGLLAGKGRRRSHRLRLFYTNVLLATFITVTVDLPCIHLI